MQRDVRSPHPLRNAAETRRRILRAATTEFAAFGLAGGRTARIAAAAPANQRMIYAYFGDKDGLFNAVIEHNVTQAQAAGLVSEVLPAERLLDTVLTLAHGNITAAGAPGAWTDSDRDQLYAAVRALTTPRR